uniref:Candidate secreted effector n=1 Tax=Meloidogyne incognita TaxID=6306 RepID=A0A914MUT3_MELIC
MFSIGNKFVIASILFVIICEFNVESFLRGRKNKVVPGPDEHAERLTEVRNELNTLITFTRMQLEGHQTPGVTADSLREEYDTIRNRVQSDTELSRNQGIQRQLNGLHALMQDLD